MSVYHRSNNKIYNDRLKRQAPFKRFSEFSLPHPPIYTDGRGIDVYFEANSTLIWKVLPIPYFHSTWKNVSLVEVRKTLEECKEDALKVINMMKAHDYNSIIIGDIVRSIWTSINRISEYNIINDNITQTTTPEPKVEIDVTTENLRKLPSLQIATNYSVEVVLEIFNCVYDGFINLINYAHSDDFDPYIFSLKLSDVRSDFRPLTDRGYIEEYDNDDEINEGELNEDLLNEGQLNEGQLNEGQINEGQLNEGQINEGQINQSQHNEGQINEGQLNQGQLNEGNANETRMVREYVSSDDILTVQKIKNILMKASGKVSNLLKKPAINEEKFVKRIGNVRNILKPISNQMSVEEHSEENTDETRLEMDPEERKERLTRLKFDLDDLLIYTAESVFSLTTLKEKIDGLRDELKMLAKNVSLSAIMQNVHGDTIEDQKFVYTIGDEEMELGKVSNKAITENGGKQVMDMNVEAEQKRKAKRQLKRGSTIENMAGIAKLSSGPDGDVEMIKRKTRFKEMENEDMQVVQGALKNESGRQTKRGTTTLREKISIDEAKKVLEFAVKQTQHLIEKLSNSNAKFIPITSEVDKIINTLKSLSVFGRIDQISPGLTDAGKTRDNHRHARVMTRILDPHRKGKLFNALGSARENEAETTTHVIITQPPELIDS